MTFPAIVPSVRSSFLRRVNTVGSVSIEEFGIEMVTGDIFGEIAFFTDDTIRIASATYAAPAKIYGLSEEQLMRLEFEDASFGIAVMRTITRRLLDPTRGLDNRSELSN